MKTRAKSFSAYGSQRGVSIITAIFLLLLFSALAALMANFQSTSELTSAEDVLGLRAHFAARSGIERVAFAVMDPNTVPASAVAALADCPASPVLPALADFPGFTVSLSCTQYPGAAAVPNYLEEGTRRSRIYRIVSVAKVAGPAGMIERQMEATVEKCRDTASVTPPFDC
jgi:MSHA biogenesis protein MshP